MKSELDDIIKDRNKYYNICIALLEYSDHVNNILNDDLEEKKIKEIKKETKKIHKKFISMTKNHTFKSMEGMFY